MPRAVAAACTTVVAKWLCIPTIYLHALGCPARHCSDHGLSQYNFTHFGSWHAQFIQLLAQRLSQYHYVFQQYICTPSDVLLAVARIMAWSGTLLLALIGDGPHGLYNCLRSCYRNIIVYSNIYLHALGCPAHHHSDHGLIRYIAARLIGAGPRSLYNCLRSCYCNIIAYSNIYLHALGCLAHRHSDHGLIRYIAARFNRSWFTRFIQLLAQLLSQYHCVLHQYIRKSSDVLLAVTRIMAWSGTLLLLWSWPAQFIQPLVQLLSQYHCVFQQYICSSSDVQLAIARIMVWSSTLLLPLEEVCVPRNPRSSKLERSHWRGVSRSRRNTTIT